VIEHTLKAAGFEVHRVTFAEPGSAPIDNLYARIGNRAPAYRLRRPYRRRAARRGSQLEPPPFAAEVVNDKVLGDTLFGRGAVDMKGGIACTIAAALDHLATRGGTPKGSISFLITGDEESVAVNGTIKLLAMAAERGEKFDHCVLGEPSNAPPSVTPSRSAAGVSLNGTLVVSGKQGHVAYPERADNPVRSLVTLMSALMAEPLDQGFAALRAVEPRIHLDRHRQRGVNLIPGEARARFNIPFTTTVTAQLR